MASETTRELRKRANELFEQVRKSERTDQINEQMDDAALHLAAMRCALIRQGFSHEEAYELLKIMIAKEIK